MTDLHGKPLDPSRMKLADYSYKRWHLDLRTHRTTDNERVTLKDLLTCPSAWGKQPNITAGDIIRVVDDGIDMQIKITASGAGGLLAEPFPKPAKNLLAVQAAVHAEENASQMDLTARMLGVAS